MKAQMMWYANIFPHVHDLMDKMCTESPSAPDGLPNESEQDMIDALEEMKITPKKQQQDSTYF